MTASGRTRFLRTPPSQPWDKRDRQFVPPSPISVAMADVTMLLKVHARTPPSLRLVELHRVPSTWHLCVRYAGVPRDAPAASCTSTYMHAPDGLCLVPVRFVPQRVPKFTSIPSHPSHSGDRVTGNKPHSSCHSLLRADTTSNELRGFCVHASSALMLLL